MRLNREYSLEAIYPFTRSYYAVLFNNQFANQVKKIIQFTNRHLYKVREGNLGITFLFFFFFLFDYP